jgi:hypothetical protein
MAVQEREQGRAAQELRQREILMLSFFIGTTNVLSPAHAWRHAEKACESLSARLKSRSPSL